MQSNILQKLSNYGIKLTLGVLYTFFKNYMHWCEKSKGHTEGKYEIQGQIERLYINDSSKNFIWRKYRGKVIR